MSDKKEKYVSFSELSTFDQCAYKRHLTYDLGHRDPPTVHTAFGNAVHNAIDEKFKGNNNSWITMGKEVYKFVRDNPYDEWIKDSAGDQVELDPKKWVRSAFRIYSEIFDWLKINFGDYELIGSEIKLYEDIEEEGCEDFKFKGYVDLFIKDESGEYHVIDFKTTDWGWNRYKRSDTKKKYQIRLYKKFGCKKMGIDESSVKTHFVLLKRNPSKKSPSACELYTITSGQKSIKNVSDWLRKSIKLIDRGFKMKDKTACKFCNFSGTDLCP